MIAIDMYSAEELNDLQAMEDKEALYEAAYNIFISTISLIVFWLVGGSAFSKLVVV